LRKKVNEAKKKGEKRGIEERRYLYLGFIEEIGVVVNNVKHIHFMKNDYLHRWNHKERFEGVSYMYADCLLLYTKNSRCHDLYSS